MAERLEIDHLLDSPAGDLSGGQRKLLELARALLTEPDLVLLDEPLAGVNPTLENKILEHIQRLESEGYSFLFIEHDIDVIMEYCQEVIVMHQGAVLTSGDPEEVRSDERVVEAYLGVRRSERPHAAARTRLPGRRLRRPADSHRRRHARRRRRVRHHRRPERRREVHRDEVRLRADHVHGREHLVPRRTHPRRRLL